MICCNIHPVLPLRLLLCALELPNIWLALQLYVQLSVPLAYQNTMRDWVAHISCHSERSCFGKPHSMACALFLQSPGKILPDYEGPGSHWGRGALPAQQGRCIFYPWCCGAQKGHMMSWDKPFALALGANLNCMIVVISIWCSYITAIMIF